MQQECSYKNCIFHVLEGKENDHISLQYFAFLLLFADMDDA